MVDKKKGVINKSEFLTASLVLIAIGFMVFVFAATEVKSPVAFGNYSGTMFLNCTTSLNASESSYNVTFYYNASGGATGTSNNLTATVWNDTAEDGVFNVTVDISLLGDALKLYNISCYADNGTSQEFASATANITIDNTPPNVTFSGITNTVNGESYNSSIVLNVSVVDSTIGIDSVYFNITNSTGDQHNFTKASNPGGDYYNITVDTTKFTDGVYTITVWANDTELNNLNNTEAISVTFDDTAPTPGSLVESSSTKTSLTITFSGADGTCTAAGTGTRVISGSTLTVTGLSCGTSSYTYTITCVDAAGNSGTSALSDSFSTSSCGGGGTVTPSFWKNTYVATKEQFKAGYTKEIKVQNRIKVQVGNSYHHVGVKELTATTATIEIASEPVEVKLNIGEDAKIDVDEDGIYDIYVTLLGIANNQANVFVQEISENVPEGEGIVSTTGEDLTTTEDEGAITPDKEKDLTWLWVLIGILVLVAVIGGWVVVNKKK